jgi:hypothetical protein
MMSPRNSVVLCAALVFVALVAASCRADRPEIGEWRQIWATRPVVPEIAELEQREARARCDQLLADIHVAQDRLLPSPDRELDNAVREWIVRVEDFGYDCPSSPDKTDQVRSRREEIQLLEAEVKAAMGVASAPDHPSSS